jgi:uncharacterized protein YegJ (DUF2314 family)
MADSPVFMFSDSDPEMQRAYEQARASFRYFWRELAWERRRIVPALDMAVVKAPFSDGPASSSAQKDHPDVEQMWIDEVDFDGVHITGVLMNDPNWLQSVKAGDRVKFTLNQITDWMYAIQNEVYGAFTVNLIRSRMKPGERADHDAAWGLNFGNPAKVRLFPEAKKSGGILSGWFGKNEPTLDEHPMSENMGPSFAKQLAANPAMVNAPDDEGWTLLHHQALAGSAATVKVLLDHGADVQARTKHGATALQLARSLGWETVTSLLLAKGARG